jgi:RNA polymerase sigma-70 factor (ECF subfamily)
MSTGFVGPNGLCKSAKDNVNFEVRWAMAAKAGYTFAFEELVTRNENRIYRLALNITQNQQDAEDLLQDTFIEAQEHLQEFRGGSRFSTWLVQICIREVLLKFQKTDPTWTGLDKFEELNDGLVPNELGDWGDHPEKRYSKTDLNRILSEAICKLTLLHRIVFLLRDVESFSTMEIADLLGLSVSETRSRLLRARLDVREYLNCHFGLDVTAESNCAGSTEARHLGNAMAIAKTAVA